MGALGWAEVFFRLGTDSYGKPGDHRGYWTDAFVDAKEWRKDAYAEMLLEKDSGREAPAYANSVGSSGGAHYGGGRSGELKNGAGRESPSYGERSEGCL